MLNVIKYLNEKTQSLKDLQDEVHELLDGRDIGPVNNAREALIELEGEFSVKYSHDERFPELYVLNYCQIDSPKFHPITQECRSLVVEFTESGEWKVVSRSFDRFFNYGETECSYNASQLVAYEKMDGSLIGVFWHEKYGWLYRTRSMIMPEGRINGLQVTWKELIEEALGEKWFNAVEAHKDNDRDYDRKLTFIMEVTSPENRVVTRYSGRKMTVLAVRHNYYGHYIELTAGSRKNLEAMGWGFPKTWTFESMTACAEAARELRNLEEGFVMYDRHGVPACKVKNPAYVAAHHLKGEGALTPKRVIRLLEINEIAEYLSVFPEDAGSMEPYVRAYFQIFAEAETQWTLYSTIQNQKEFAMKVGKCSVGGLLFRKRQGQDFKESFFKMTDRNKVDLVEKFLCK